MTRKEISGLHLYNKLDGLHILFDEINFKDEDILYTGPRQLSIMLTKNATLSVHIVMLQKLIVNYIGNYCNKY